MATTIALYVLSYRRPKKGFALKGKDLQTARSKLFPFKVGLSSEGNKTILDRVIYLESVSIPLNSLFIHY